MNVDDAGARPLPPWTDLLGYAGLVPFVGAALAMLVLPEAGTRELVGRVLAAYGAAILAFLGGVHWGLVLRDRPSDAPRRLGFGVLPSLVGWLALLLPFEQAMAVLVAGFGGFWLYEHRMLGPSVLPAAYLGLRRWLTLIVCASLGLALIAPELVPTV